jgi:hypothetical protein
MQAGTSPRATDIKNFGILYLPFLCLLAHRHLRTKTPTAPALLLQHKMHYIACTAPRKAIGHTRENLPKTAQKAKSI